MTEVKEKIKIQTTEETGVGLGIILSGKSHVGKDSVAKQLTKFYGFKKYSIADTLKEHCSNKYDYPYDWNYSQEGKQRIVKNTGGKTVREILIKEGALGRKTDLLFWVKKLVTKLMIEKPAFYVITDCRYKNEAEVFKYFNGVLVRLNADDESRIKWGCPEEILHLTDDSETELDNYEGFNLIYDLSYGVRNDEVAKAIVQEIFTKGI